MAFFSLSLSDSMFMISDRLSWTSLTIMWHSLPVFEYGIQIQNYFTSAESKAFIKAAESIGFAHQGSLGPAKGEAYRDNDRISVSDPILAEAMWQSGLQQLLSDFRIQGKVAVGLNPNIRLYRFVTFASFTY